MDLYFLRHGVAEPAEPGQPDRERALTPKGICKLERIAKSLVTLKVCPDRILASPLRRTEQTARIVTRYLKAPLDFTSGLQPDANPQEFLKTLPNRGSILLVGHEPLLSQMISLLLSGQNDLAITLKKGGLCKLVLPDGKGPLQTRATLEWLLAPRQLRRLK